MSEEVKKILEQLKDSIEYPKIDVPTFDGTDYEYIDNDTLLEPEKCKLLLNYITNLQEQLKIKNEGFKATVEELCDTTKKYEDYKSRCERLLEKINFYKTTEWGLRGYAILDLFENILNGSDKE